MRSPALTSAGVTVYPKGSNAVEKRALGKSGRVHERSLAEIVFPAATMAAETQSSMDCFQGHVLQWWLNLNGSMKIKPVFPLRLHRRY